MTYEELKRARRDQAWLVWKLSRGTTLVRIVYLYNTDTVTCKDTKGNYHDLHLEELCIATPNDMLKYGE